MRYDSTLVNYGVTLAVATVLGLVLFFRFGIGTTVNQDVAVHALEKQGFTDIQIVNRIWFLPNMSGCGNDDSVLFVAKATNPVGKNIVVNVCAGVLKGATIRY